MREKEQQGHGGGCGGGRQLPGITDSQGAMKEAGKAGGDQLGESSSGVCILLEAREKF